MSKPGKPNKLRYIFIGLAAVTSLLISVAVIAYVTSNEPRPEGEPGPEAEALADAVQKAVNVEAWDKEVGAISWNFGGLQQHLWDRRRGLARVTFEEHVVWLELASKTGLVHTNGVEVTGEEAQVLLEKAWKFWVNDSFWLNPLAKLEDPGTTRSLVSLADGKRGLLVEYSGGGATPGDAYLWIIGDDDIPVAWKMWVEVIPMGGMEATWDAWETLPGGAKVSTQHVTSLFTLEITDIKAAKDIAALTGDETNDPFKAIAKPGAAPTSQP